MLRVVSDGVLGQIGARKARGTRGCLTDGVVAKPSARTAAVNMAIKNVDEVSAFTKKDGSDIRESLADHRETVLTEPERKDLAC
jgi:hypothetical protein